MSKALNFGAGLALGALVGVGFVMLLAPQSGEDTRQAIQEWIQSVLDEGKDAYETRRLELTTQFEDLKRPAATDVAAAGAEREAA